MKATQQQLRNIQNTNTVSVVVRRLRRRFNTPGCKAL